MTTRQPGDVVAVCPVCGGFVDVLNPEQIPRTEGLTDEQFIEHVVETNSAILRAHAEATHSVHEVLLALGVARHALILLEEGSRNAPALHGPSVNQIARDGLGGK